MSRLISLTKGKFTIVDDEDYEWLSQWKWHYNNGGYAVRAITTTKNKQTLILMHRIITNAPPDKQVDHIDHDKLNNVRINLRACTHAENQHNRCRGCGTSKFKGVCWHKRDKKWMSSIRIYDKLKHLGCFVNEIDAAKAYDKAARELFGEFAFGNFSMGDK